MVAGAIIGSKIGGEMNDRGEKVDELSSSLQGSRNRIEELERDIDQLDGDLHRARSESRPELLSLLQAGIEMDLLFRTDEDVLTSDTEARLQQLAASVAAMPDVYIRLDGYADERGDAEYNRKLSVRRAEHVRDVLQAGGIAAQRIDLEAHGESPAMDASIDSLALERRVSLTLFTKESPSFAANPN
jgi:outer membrane protein OmpA-like peptidoglycan-associated protein